MNEFNTQFTNSKLFKERWEGCVREFTGGNKDALKPGGTADS